MNNLIEELADFVFASKYARYNEKEQRRETWEEAVTRVEEMHLKKFAFLPEEDKKEIKQAFVLVREKRVVPSMRSMQFGGKAIEAKNERIFNCSVRHIDSIRAFSEVFYLLLCGTGVGIGLSQHFLSRLPDLVNADDKTGSVLTYSIEDSIEGWSDSLQALLNCYFKNTGYSGRKIVFDYSKIRRKGAKLKTGGGKAPGYKPLKLAHSKIKELLDRVIEDNEQTRMKSIDVYDVLMHTADAVLSGGVRRSATCVVFQKDDEDMLNAKTGDWYKTNPQRARSNNSILLMRDEVSKEEFEKIVERTKEWGEPGFLFADHAWTLFNPCFEVSFLPVTDDGVCGVQMCNLTSINGAKVKNKEDFQECTKAATIIGTLQATYTEFPYLVNASEQLTREEALLGVSITGIMDSPDVLLDKANQREMAKHAVDVNKEWAKKLGVNQAARITLLKPEGTTSLALGCSSGIHPHHAHKYFRRVQMNKEEAIYRYFKKHNPHMCEPSFHNPNKTDDIITFPITVPSKSITKDQLGAIEHLEIIKNTQQNWVLPGTTEANKKPLAHNVSCTVEVKQDEWKEVIDYLYKNRKYFTAVALLAKSGDKDYTQAPLERVATEEDKKKFNDLLEKFKHVDYTGLKELHDDTEVQQVIACGGGACERI